MASKALVKAIKDAAFLTGQFTTRAGKQTDFYIDKYLFETRPDILDPLAKEVAALFPDPSTYDRIGAPELGAVPIAAVVSVVLKKPFIILKKKTKEYGTQKKIEGAYKKGERLVILEDILTTGGAALNACETAEAEGLIIKEIIGIIHREEGATENITAKGYPLKALIKVSELKAC